MDEKFSIFMGTVDERFRSFVSYFNEYLTGNGCKCDIRIYPEHIGGYQSFLDTLPEKIKKEIKKASVCKRLINPADCNPKCIMGYTFVLDGEQYQRV